MHSIYRRFGSERKEALHTEILSMIDINKESPVSLEAAASLDILPTRRGGRRPVPATIFRWAQTGLRGVRLETIQVGGTKCTTREAMQRFFARLTDAYATTDANQNAITQIVG
jgi:hypothetical protein